MRTRDTQDVIADTSAVIRFVGRARQGRGSSGGLAVMPQKEVSHDWPVCLARRSGPTRHLIAVWVCRLRFFSWGFHLCAFACQRLSHRSHRRTGDLVAYWRLGEPSTTPVPSSGGAARSVVADENGDVHHGDYFKLDPVSAPDDLRHSPATIGTLILGVTPGLLELGDQVNSPCINTDGGYVQVPWADELNPPQFTFEAWVLPETFLGPEIFLLPGGIHRTPGVGAEANRLGPLPGAL